MAAPSVECAKKVTYEAMKILSENGGELPMREVTGKVPERVTLTDWEKERYEKTGYIRWESILHFYSVNMVKAGFLLKKKGVWYLTPEGEEAVAKGKQWLHNEGERLYKAWAKKQEQKKKEAEEAGVEEADDIDDVEQKLTAERVESLARESIEAYIRARGPYEFQDLVAALLRAMGYYTPLVAPKGKDGGIDIVAYRDPLGTQSPRVLVQVKHKESTTGVQELRQLMGVLGKDGAVGLFVSTGGFSSDAKVESRNAYQHIELIDMTRFIELWQEFYPKMDDEDRALLRLKTVYMLAPE